MPILKPTLKSPSGGWLQYSSQTPVTKIKTFTGLYYPFRRTISFLNGACQVFIAHTEQKPSYHSLELKYLFPLSYPTFGVFLSMLFPFPSH